MTYLYLIVRTNTRMRNRREQQEEDLFSCRSVTKPYSSTSSKGSGKHKSITPNLQLAQSEVKIKIT